MVIKVIILKVGLCVKLIKTINSVNVVEYLLWVDMGHLVKELLL